MGELLPLTQGIVKSLLWDGVRAGRGWTTAGGSFLNNERTLAIDYW